MANRPLRDRRANTYNMTEDWPRPWNDLDLDDHITGKDWASNKQNSSFYHSDLELDPLTLVLNLNLNIVKMYHHIPSFYVKVIQEF